jgi:hypothetical protein
MYVKQRGGRTTLWEADSVAEMSRVEQLPTSRGAFQFGRVLIAIIILLVLVVVLVRLMD